MTPGRFAEGSAPVNDSAPRILPVGNLMRRAEFPDRWFPESCTSRNDSV